MSGDAALTAKDIIANAATIQNVRLWDHDPLLQTFAQIQEIRTYYDFRYVDNDRYNIHGKYRQVMLSVRELNTESMQNRSWVNERLVFTHGYGLTLGPVNEVTTEGLPVLFIRDLPPVSTVDIKLDEPSIYFGELSNDYVLVRTQQPEFHYPRGDDNVTTTYTGSGGVQRRQLHAAAAVRDPLRQHQHPGHEPLTPESRIIFHRRISERVRELAPFLSVRHRPLSGGQRTAGCSGFRTRTRRRRTTRTRRAVEPQGGALNYIRNSVKIVIDAYHGSTTFYLAEPTDPHGADAREHLPRHAEAARRHAGGSAAPHALPGGYLPRAVDGVPAVPHDEPGGLLQQGGSVADAGARRRRQLDADPAVLHDHAAARPDRSPSSCRCCRSRRGSRRTWRPGWWRAATPAHYGKLLVYPVPEAENRLRPETDQRPDQPGSGDLAADHAVEPAGYSVIWGTLLVIPIDESLLYVRPLYLRSPEGRIPELKRVIVAYQSQIVMAETLVDALAKIFGPAVAKALAPGSAGQHRDVGRTRPHRSPARAPAGRGAGGRTAGCERYAALVAELRQHVDRADKALRDGDFALYGEEWKKIKAVLEKMEKTEASKSDGELRASADAPDSNLASPSP